MSRVEELIAEICPDGIQFRELGSVCKVFNGYAFKAELFNTDGSGLPLIRIRDVNTGFSETYYSGDFDERYTVNDGDILIGMDGDFRATRWKHGLGLLNQRVCRLQDFSPEMLPAFMFYKIQDELDRIQNGTQGSTVKHLSSKELEKSRIPVPPLEIQQEIVKILDAFTELEVVLEAELEARQSQYAYYRHELLSFEERNDVPAFALNAITRSIASGRNKSRKLEGRFPVYGSTGIIGYTDTPAYCGEFILVARVGANAGLVNAVAGEFDVSDNTLVICLNSEWNFRFAYHQLTQMNLNQFAVGGGQPLVTGSLLKNLVVSLPSLVEQTYIANVLDKFDALVNDLSFGLPAELQARRQQYEYYRDRLLSFKEAA